MSQGKIEVSFSTDIGTKLHSASITKYWVLNSFNSGKDESFLNERGEDDEEKGVKLGMLHLAGNLSVLIPKLTELRISLLMQPQLDQVGNRFGASTFWSFSDGFHLSYSTTSREPVSFLDHNAIICNTILQTRVLDLIQSEGFCCGSKCIDSPRLDLTRFGSMTNNNKDDSGYASYYLYIPIQNYRHEVFLPLIHSTDSLQNLPLNNALNINCRTSKEWSLTHLHVEYVNHGSSTAIKLRKIGVGGGRVTCDDNKIIPTPLYDCTGSSSKSNSIYEYPIPPHCTVKTSNTNCSSTTIPIDLSARLFPNFGYHPSLHITISLIKDIPHTPGHFVLYLPLLPSAFIDTYQMEGLKKLLPQGLSFSTHGSPDLEVPVSSSMALSNGVALHVNDVWTLLNNHGG
jgi:hypothetical protein